MAKYKHVQHKKDDKVATATTRANKKRRMLKHCKANLDDSQNWNKMIANTLP